MELKLPRGCVEAAKSVELVILTLQDCFRLGKTRLSGLLYSDRCLICKCHGNLKDSVFGIQCFTYWFYMRRQLWCMAGVAAILLAFFFWVLLEKIALNPLLIICYSWGVWCLLLSWCELYKNPADTKPVTFKHSLIVSLFSLPFNVTCNICNKSSLTKPTCYLF